MSDSKTEVDQDVEHGQEVAGLLPALALLDQTARELEQKTAAGEEVTAADISAYKHQAAHAQHLVEQVGTTAKEVAAAEKDHRGDGEKGFAARALDHAAHPRPYEPSPSEDDQGRDRDDEEIDL